MSWIVNHVTEKIDTVLLAIIRNVTFNCITVLFPRPAINRTAKENITLIDYDNCQLQRLLYLSYL